MKAPPSATGDLGRVKGRWWTDSRIRDYVLEWLLTLVVIVVPLAVAVFRIPFRPKAISILDATISQPYVAIDSLPILFVFEISTIVPLIAFWTYPYLLSKFAKQLSLAPHDYSSHYSYWWSSCLIQSVLVTVLLSELSKRLVQAPRPDFMGRCFPDGIPPQLLEQARNTNFMVSTTDCLPRNKDIFEDGLQACPSEHTSLTCALMTVLILFFYTLRREMVSGAERLAVARRAEQKAHKEAVAEAEARGLPGPKQPKVVSTIGNAGAKADAAGLKPLSADSSVLANASQAFWPYSHVVYIVHMLIPFGWMVSVGLSRTFDHRHSISDVLAGAALGLVVALAVYRMHLIQISGSYRRFEEDAAARGAAISAAAPLPQREKAAPSVFLEGQAKGEDGLDTSSEEDNGGATSPAAQRKIKAKKAKKSGSSKALL